MAAPVDRGDNRPKWINPCGLDPHAGRGHEYSDVESDIPIDYHSDELLERIIVTARNALVQAQHFREDYVKNNFNMGFYEFHDIWKSRRCEWLPSYDEIPKDLEKNLDRSHLERLRLEDTLRHIYTYLQKYAVGLEQVTWDQKEDTAFKRQFEAAEYKLRATLCEVQVAMLDIGVNQPDDIQRDLMSDRMRNLKDLSVRNLRDWVIYRDYMNGLEYTIQALDSLKTK